MSIRYWVRTAKLITDGVAHGQERSCIWTDIWKWKRKRKGFSKRAKTGSLSDVDRVAVGGSAIWLKGYRFLVLYPPLAGFTNGFEVQADASGCPAAAAVSCVRWGVEWRVSRVCVAAPGFVGFGRRCGARRGAAGSAPTRTSWSPELASERASLWCRRRLRVPPTGALVLGDADAETPARLWRVKPRQIESVAMEIRSHSRQRTRESQSNPSPTRYNSVQLGNSVSWPWPWSNWQLERGLSHYTIQPSVRSSLFRLVPCFDRRGNVPWGLRFPRSRLVFSFGCAPLGARTFLSIPFRYYVVRLVVLLMLLLLLLLLLLLFCSSIFNDVRAIEWPGRPVMDLARITQCHWSSSSSMSVSVSVPVPVTGPTWPATGGGVGGGGGDRSAAPTGATFARGWTRTLGRAVSKFNGPHGGCTCFFFHPILEVGPFSLDLNALATRKVGERFVIIARWFHRGGQAWIEFFLAELFGRNR